MEQQIKLAAKLYKCRDTAKALFKAEYLEKLKPYIHIIKHVMEKHECKNELDAIIKISTTETYTTSGMAQLMFMAAAVEMIEPSKPE